MARPLESETDRALVKYFQIELSSMVIKGNFPINGLRIFLQSHNQYGDFILDRPLILSFPKNGNL